MDNNGTQDGKHDRPLFILGMIATAICAVLIILEAFTAFYKSGLVFDNLSGAAVNIIIIFPFPVALFSISGAALQMYYVMLLIAMGVSAAIMFIKAAPKVIEFIEGERSMERTALYEVSVLFGVTTGFSLMFTIFLSAITGSELTSPLEDYETWELMFLLLEASVWEEVIARIMLIGVPMLLIAVATGNRERKWWRNLTGGFGMSRTAVVLILFSAVVFGIAHVPGWDLWKAVPTFVTGLALGYLFVKYGVYASIMLHFLVDYLSFSDWLFGNAIISSLAMLAVIAICLLHIWVYFKRGTSYIAKMS